MYIRDESRIHTGPTRSVTCGTLRALSLSFELRAAPRDPYFNEIKMQGKSEAANSVLIRLPITAKDETAIEVTAPEMKLTVTDYLTCAGLECAVWQRVDVEAINLLRTCVDELIIQYQVCQPTAKATKFRAYNGSR
ncbi:hypothetical protein OKW33_002697 [Paraburkholderia atlantica]|uniref:hypothetical protein n=1 Tax=Paraburkholderia atlantica TaxID=2654982 RepID=UPI003D1C82A0